ncbi:MAG: carbon-nitrogen hydrolase family protein [Actinomycetota bacterium]
MTVTAAQPAVATGELVANIERHAAMVDRASGRVVVFPELSLTGYDLGSAPVDPVDDRLAPLVGACARRGAVALVGAPTVDVDGAHLSMLAVDGRGVRVAYRKMYLGADEAARFVPGAEPQAIDVGGWRLGLAICRDTGLAEHAERTMALRIDAYVAGVCEHAADRHVVEERAVRITAAHRVPVVVASFAGSTGEGYDPAAGGSGIWAATGANLVRAGPEPDRLVEATLRR